MAIYAKFGKMQGSVTAESFENDIECQSFNFGGGRFISQGPIRLAAVEVRLFHSLAPGTRKNGVGQRKNVFNTAAG